MTRLRSLGAGCLLLALAGAPALAQGPTAAPADKFASRWVASRMLSPSTLLALAKDPDPVNRQLAMLQLTESGTPASGAIDALVRGLSDPVERVRLQAAAGLMRLGQTVTAPLVRALADETVIGPVEYGSEAFNGPLKRILRASDMAFTVLLHSNSVDAEVVLRAYTPRRGEPARTSRGTLSADPDSPDHRRTTFADRLLGVLEHAPIVMTPALTAALRSRDARLASIAAERIGRFGEEAAAAIPALASAATRHPVESAREAAARGLLHMGPGGTDALRRLLVSTQAPARQAALAVLPIDAAEANASIVAGVRGSDESVRKTALRRLEQPTGDRFGGPCDRFESEDREDDWTVAARRLIESLPRALAADLAALLRHRDAEMRAVAIGAFTRFGCVRGETPEATAESIARALADPVPAVRTQAVDALARLDVHGIRPPSSMLPVLVAAMRRESGDRKGELLLMIAASEVADVERHRLVEELVTTCVPLRRSVCADVAEFLMRTPASADVAVAVISERLRHSRTKTESDDLFSMLERLGSDRAIVREALERLVAERNDSLQLRATLALASHRWLSPAVMNVLVAAATGFKPSGSEGEAAQLLINVGDDGVTRLLALLDDPATPRATKPRLISNVLSRTAGKNTRIAVWLLAAAERSTDSAVQASAVGTLSQIPDRQEEVRRVLAAAVASSDAAVRQQAVTAWVAANLPVDDAILRTLRDPDTGVRQRAMPLLSRIPTETTRLDAARLALADTDPEVRSSAVDAVARLGSTGADLLAAYLQDHDVTYAFLRAIRALRPLGPRLADAIEQKWQAADTRLRAAIDETLGRVKPQPEIDRTRLRERLDSSDPSDRVSAARALVDANQDLWRADGRLVAVLLDAQVMAMMKERFGQAMDELYPPGGQQESARPLSMPTFPWPPPAGYSGVAVPRSLLALGPRATVGDVYVTVVRALNAASSGFTQGLFSAPGGFALVARMERIAADGTPLPGRARWIKEGTPTLSLIEFLGDLFFERPGYFRVVAFIVTNNPQVGSDPGARLPLPEEGVLAIPPELASLPFADQELVALVYSFERRLNAQIQPWQDGAPSPREHLERAGIWAGLIR